MLRKLLATPWMWICEKEILKVGNSDYGYRRLAMNFYKLVFWLKFMVGNRNKLCEKIFIQMFWILILVTVREQKLCWSFLTIMFIYCLQTCCSIYILKRLKSSERSWLATAFRNPRDWIALARLVLIAKLSPGWSCHTWPQQLDFFRFSPSCSYCQT